MEILYDIMIKINIIIIPAVILAVIIWAAEKFNRKSE